jgi:hypothetical protein
VARPALAPELIARMEPWLELCEQAIAKGFARLGVRPPVPLEELAYAIVTFYLGVNLLTHLDPNRRIDALFAQLELVAPGLSSLVEDVFGRGS